jgi:hypothetical protein
MQPVPAPGAADTRTLARPRRPAANLVVAGIMTAIVIVGFWPTFYGPVLRGASALPALYLVHGAIFTGWMALLLAQISLAVSGRIAAHRKLGTFGIGYGVVVWVIGLAMSIGSAVLEVRKGTLDLNQAAGVLVIPLGDMVLFGGFFGAAVWYRSRPENHKRLMLLATQALLFAAFGRLGEELSFLPLPIYAFIWLTPLLLAMVYEAITLRRVHRVYLIGFFVLLALTPRGLLAGTEAWRRVGRAILSPFL